MSEWASRLASGWLGLLGSLCRWEHDSRFK